jgi:alpha-beta hydrolase superfamily lysophospholipase
MFARLSSRLAAAGIASFRFDHRGCGESDGDFLDFTPDGMLEDLEAATTVFLSSRWLNRKKMAVVGYSLGGTSAAYVTTQCPEFLTAVLWAPVARPEIIRDRLATLDDFSLYEQKGYFDYGGFRVSPDYIDHIGKMKPVEWLSTFTGPVLFCHGLDDDIVKPEQSERFIEARRNPADRKLLIEGADHSFTLADNIDRLLDKTEKWLAERLTPEGLRIRD